MVKRMGEQVIYMSGSDFEAFMEDESEDLAALVEKLKQQ
jgi:hypothetical protein